MSKIYEYFNLFSQTPSLRINGKSRPLSIFGSIIGLTSISIFITSVSIIFNNYFSRLNYTFNSYTDNLVTPSVNLDEFKMGFDLRTATGTDISDHDRVYSLGALFWEINVPLLGNNLTSISAKPNPITVIKCNQYEEGSLFSEDFVQYSKNSKNLKCLDFKSLNRSLIGSYGNLGT
jgi:hypothetical protein